MQFDTMRDVLDGSFAARDAQGRAAWGRPWTNPAEQAVYERVTGLAWQLITCPLRTHRNSTGALYRPEVRERIAPVAEHLAFSGAVSEADQTAFQVAAGYDPSAKEWALGLSALTIPSCHQACEDRSTVFCAKRGRVRFARRLASTLALVLDYQLPFDLGLGMPRVTERRPETVKPIAPPCGIGCRHARPRGRQG